MLWRSVVLRYRRVAVDRYALAVAAVGVVELIAIAVVIGVVGLLVAWVVRRRRHSRARRVVTVEQKLRAARRASGVIRRSRPRADRDVFDRGEGIGEKHSTAVFENNVYGDMAGGGGGSD